MRTVHGGWRTLLRHDAGSAVIEFALIVPIFFLILWAAMNMSRAYQRLNMMTLAIREGARYGATLNPPNVALVQARVDSASNAAGLGPLPSTVQYFGNDSVRVSVANYPLFVDLSSYDSSSTGILSSLLVSRATVFRLERP